MERETATAVVQQLNEWGVGSAVISRGQYRAGVRVPLPDGREARWGMDGTAASGRWCCATVCSSGSCPRCSAARPPARPRSPGPSPRLTTAALKSRRAICGGRPHRPRGRWYGPGTVDRRPNGLFPGWWRGCPGSAEVPHGQRDTALRADPSVEGRDAVHGPWRRLMAPPLPAMPSTGCCSSSSGGRGSVSPVSPPPMTPTTCRSVCSPWCTSRVCVDLGVRSAGCAGRPRSDHGARRLRDHAAGHGGAVAARRSRPPTGTVSGAARCSRTSPSHCRRGRCCASSARPASASRPCCRCWCACMTPVPGRSGWAGSTCGTWPWPTSGGGGFPAAR